MTLASRDIFDLFELKSRPRNFSHRIDWLETPRKMQIKNQGFPWLIFPWSQPIEVPWAGHLALDFAWPLGHFDRFPALGNTHIAAIKLSTSHTVFEYGWQPWKLVISWRFYWTYAFPKSILINGWSSVMNPQPEERKHCWSTSCFNPHVATLDNSHSGLFGHFHQWIASRKKMVRNPPYCIGKSWKVNGFL